MPARSLSLLSLLPLCGCITTTVVNIGQKSALEKQLMGETDPLSEEELLVASVRATGGVHAGSEDDLTSRAGITLCGVFDAVPHDPPLECVDTLIEQIPLRALRGREVQGCESGGQNPVHLFGEWPAEVAGAQAGLDVRHQDMAVKRRERSGEREAGGELQAVAGRQLQRAHSPGRRELRGGHGKMR